MGNHWVKSVFKRERTLSYDYHLLADLVGSACFPVFFFSFSSFLSNCNANRRTAMVLEHVERLAESRRALFTTSEL